MKPKDSGKEITNLPDKELLEFAEEFSKNYLKLKAGDYFSKSKKYQIAYRNELINDKPEGYTRPLKTFARISNNTGTIELDRTELQKMDNNNFVYFLIFWLIIRKSVKSEYEADIDALKYYKTTNRYETDIINGWAEQFKKSPSILNAKRMEQMLEFLKSGKEQGDEDYVLDDTEYGTAITIDELVGHYGKHFLTKEQFKDLLIAYKNDKEHVKKQLNMETNNCKGIFGKLFGHNFKAVYDTKSHLPSENLQKSNEGVFSKTLGVMLMFDDAINNALRNLRTNESKYIKSICSRCGKAINEQSDKNE